MVNCMLSALIAIITSSFRLTQTYLTTWWNAQAHEKRNVFNAKKGQLLPESKRSLGNINKSIEQNRNQSSRSQHTEVHNITTPSSD